MRNQRGVPTDVRFEGSKVIGEEVDIFITVGHGATRRFTSIRVPVQRLCTEEVYSAMMTSLESGRRLEGLGLEVTLF